MNASRSGIVKMSEPDLVYDDFPINEYWWDFLRENNIEPGDKIRVVTETTEWKSKMEILDRRTGELWFESVAGKEYAIVTYSNIHPLEPEQPIVRDMDGFDSKGVLDRVEIYKQ